MTARTRCGWAKIMECGELLHGRRFLHDGYNPGSISMLCP